MTATYKNINNKFKTNESGKILTAAALMLPGIISSISYAADGDEIDFQYGHYQEGSRNIIISNPSDLSLSGQKNSDPIEVETLHGTAKISLSDRVKFAFNYVQDTWGGATPIASGPAALGLNAGIASRNTNVITGASPLVNSPYNGFLTFFDKNYAIHSQNIGTGEIVKDNRLTHILATASPEVRKQGDFKLSYQWDNAAVSFGGGISVEDDYESRFGNVGGQWDFNEKRTNLNLGISYTNSQTNAILSHDSVPYTEGDGFYAEHVKTSGREDSQVLSGTRQDWAANFGVTQILNDDALLSADVGYIRSTGYLSNPYKLTEAVFVNPDDFLSSDLVSPNAVAAFLERRPEVRNQWNLGGRYVQYIKPLDAALHFEYKFSADDWGIQAHSFEADWVQPLGDGWAVTPSVRYYSQDAADFYHPYLLVKKAYNSDGVDLNANSSQLPANFSSDQRLSGFGALSGGVTISKRFAKGLSLETGFEYYTHQGSMKLGGGGEGSYADYDYWVANAALKVDLDTLSKGMMQAMGGMDHSAHAGHDMSKMDHSGHTMAQMDHSAHAGHGGHHHGTVAPAGVMSSHMLAKAGDWMIGYRFQWSNQSGALRNGTRPVSDRELIAKGCRGGVCALAPDSMPMSMHMLDLMVAPTDWLTLMLMPQWMDMDMKMRALDGVPPYDDNVPSSHIAHHAQNGHESGGFGDLGMYALFKLYDDSTHHLHITPGFTAPIGDVDLHLRRGHQSDGGFMHYCMQLGSGTWDFAPNLTYTGHLDDWSWGAQLNGVVRMGNKNKSGYRLGDIFQATAWGGYNITPWLTATLRGVYTTQGSIRGQYSGSEGGQFITGTDKDDNLIYSSILKFGSMDYPDNYGGRFGDVGFGLSGMVPSGDLAGIHFSVEWLQPIYNDMNGYQQNRDGTLNATWGIMF